jgi:hypothetical protein
MLAALDVFLQEHRRCGDLDGGVDDERLEQPEVEVKEAS